MTWTTRAPRWPDDERALGSLDRSFESDEIARISYDGRFDLTFEKVTPPYARTEEPVDFDDLRSSDNVLIAEDHGVVMGYGVLRCRSWNKRADVTALYVDAAHRGKGVGRALLDALEAAARKTGVNRMWLETQDVNVPAVRFYLATGFSLAGLDTSLYDPDSRAGGETALYFVRSLT